MSAYKITNWLNRWQVWEGFIIKEQFAEKWQAENYLDWLHVFNNKTARPDDTFTRGDNSKRLTF